MRRHLRPFYRGRPQAKQQKNRGVNEIWADAVQRAAANASQGVAPKALSDNLIRMGELGNVPRQEKKFKVNSNRPPQAVLLRRRFLFRELSADHRARLLGVLKNGCGK